MLGRPQILTGLVGLGIAVLAYLWWDYGHVAYEPVWAEEVEIAGETFKVRRWEGVASPDDAGGLRACFLLQQEIPAPPELNPQVPTAPDWLRCFNSEFIAEALASGKGKAYVAARNDPPGYDRVIAVLPGGRIYMWPQPNGE